MGKIVNVVYIEKHNSLPPLSLKTYNEAKDVRRECFWTMRIFS